MTSTSIATENISPMTNSASLFPTAVTSRNLNTPGISTMTRLAHPTLRVLKAAMTQAAIRYTSDALSNGGYRLVLEPVLPSSQTAFVTIIKKMRTASWLYVRNKPK